MDWYLMAESGGLMEALQGFGSTLWVIASVALTLGFVIFVHELGHFLAAKACGVKCEKFYIGFDVPMRIGPLKLPSALCRFRWGETEYGIGSLPLGGYVKMLGQDDNPSAQKEENQRIRVRKSASAEVAAKPVSGDGGQAGRAEAAAGQDADANRVSPALAGQADDGGQDQELDPRSFPAKPVWQRMIIISAGVVMNLIFAVVFAAVAYRMGVRYVPCIIGETIADSPAWREGIAPQDKILQLTRKYPPDEHLRFRRDLMPQVVLNGGEKPMELLVRRHGQSQTEWISIQPVNRNREAERATAADLAAEPSGPRAEARAKALQMLPKTASLGVTSIGTTVVSPLMTTEAYRREYPELASLETGDEIVAVDGVPLPRDEDSGKIFSTHLEKYLAERLSEPVTLTIERPAGIESQEGPANSPQRFEVTLLPSRLRMLGMSMRLGAIASVRPGTPADVAGLRAGDRLISIRGEDLGDSATLAQRVLGMVGEEIEIRYERGGREQTLRLTPEAPRASGEPIIYGAALTLEPLGIALPVENLVADVEADGPAARAGVQPGDEIIAVQLVLEDPQQLAKAKELYPSYERPIYLARSLPYWAYLQSIVQRALPGTGLQLSIVRQAANAEESAAATPPDPGPPGGNPAQREFATLQLTLLPVESDTWYSSSRGLALSSLTRVRTADSWGEAWKLGVRETSESVTQVVRVLHGLLTGRISWTNLGGPITIATAAGFEASEGFSQLLIFLTLLSANLAVLNFLPIPALDGGHMVFLAAEGIRGKPIDERLQFMLTAIGIMFLLGLIVILSIKDVGTLLQLFG